MENRKWTIYDFVSSSVIHVFALHATEEAGSVSRALPLLMALRALHNESPSHQHMNQDSPEIDRWY
jgi:hypothetical protein